MGISIFIAKRYILSKKSTNAINIISGISVVGIIVATMALVVVLSVFNGFHDLVANMLTNFDPQIKIVAVEGKSMACDDPALLKVKQLDCVEVATECVEDLALAVYEGKQMMVNIKGVEDNFEQLTRIKEILYGDQRFCTHAGVIEYALPGGGIAQDFGLNMNKSMFINIYAPVREGQLDMSNPEEGFVADSLMLEPTVFYVGQQRYDKHYILTSVSFARQLFGLQGEMTSMELRMKPGESIDAAKSEISAILGDKYKVMDRYEQQADTFRIMQIEKILAYVFLTFILMVACFNIIGSISMLIIDKKNDVMVLRNLGATDSQITKIFLFEGRMISALGAVIGVVLGLALCLAQQMFGIIKMGSEGSYLATAYPLSVHYTDILIVFVTVVAVSWCAVWYPVKHMSRRLL